MPLYIYECSACEKRAESLAKVDDDAPQCECGQQMVKAVAMSSFRLRGAWFKQGYTSG